MYFLRSQRAWLLIISLRRIQNACCTILGVLLIFLDQVDKASAKIQIGNIQLCGLYSFCSYSILPQSKAIGKQMDVAIF